MSKMPFILFFVSHEALLDGLHASGWGCEEQIGACASKQNRCALCEQPCLIRRTGAGRDLLFLQF